MSTFYGGPELKDIISVSGNANNSTNILYVVPVGRYAEVQLVKARGQCNNNGVSNGGQVGEVIYGLAIANGEDITEDYKDYAGALQLINEGEIVAAKGTAFFADATFRIYEYIKP